MKRRLFWKILLGFWLTTIVLTQFVWLMFDLLRPLPQQNDNQVDMGRVAVTAATAAIHSGGAPAMLAQMASWPGYLRGQVSVQAVPKGTPQIAGSTLAADPSGALYRITFRARDRRPRGGPPRSALFEFFDIPPAVMIGSVIGGLGFSFILAWYLTNPIRRMRLGFGSLAQGNFATRLGPAMGRRRDEIADLAHDFDRMAERLEELVKARDRLLADVSHELRSPLARLQLAIGLARQDPSRLETSLQRIDREAAKLDELVGELLTLSKLESGVEHSEQYFDIAEIVKVVVEDAKFEATPAGIEVSVETDPPEDKAEWLCAGSGRLIARALENIVRNAIRFSHSGQQVKVRLMATKDARFELTIMDQGPGVAEDMLGRLFQPFVKGTGEGQGFGLGLAIAQRAIIAHGGTIAARNRSTRGLLVSVTLPAAPAQD